MTERDGFYLSDEQHAQTQHEGWGVFEVDDGAITLQIQRLDEDAVFESDPQAWAHVIEQARAGSALHGYVLAYFNAHFPEEYAIYTANVPPLPTADENRQQAFIIADGSDVLIYSDNNEWASVDGELALADLYGFPLWPEKDPLPVNGRFTAEDYPLNKFLMIAATEAYDQNDELDSEDLDTIAHSYSPELSQAAGISVDEAYALIHTHLEQHFSV